ncbi:MAG: hypothetical protein K2G94_02750 [Muribaculaceae bacterium]|nr:hypothetical protein [Muribaculaceae bacterium]
MKHCIIKSLGALVVIASLCSCRPSDADSTDTSPAAERGQADAAALCTDSVGLTEHELTNAILAVRSREWQMRSQGFDADADAYIEAFRQYIIDNNEQLAKELF